MFTFLKLKDFSSNLVVYYDPYKNLTSLLCLKSYYDNSSLDSEFCLDQDIA